MKINKFNLGIGIIALIALYAALGMTGSRVVLAYAILMVFPIYMILGAFKIESDERVLFSLFLGVGIIPSIVYYLGMLIDSITFASIISAAGIVGLAVYLKRSSEKE